MPIIESDPSAEEKLRQKYGGTWGQHPHFPVDDWKHEVGNGDTRQGYWSFVESAVWNQVDEVLGMKYEDLPLEMNYVTSLCQEAQDRYKERLSKGE